MTSLHPNMKVRYKADSVTVGWAISSSGESARIFIIGLISHWWHANKQVAGRGVISIRSAETLPVLDFRTLSDEQLATAETIFDELRDLQLQPAYLADADPNRALLDRRVICDLLGFDETTYAAVRRLAAKWCAEPSVHGGKKRPRGARLVI